jgi:hypothetical protein
MIYWKKKYFISAVSFSQEVPQKREKCLSQIVLKIVVLPIKKTYEAE